MLVWFCWFIVCVWCDPTLMVLSDEPFTPTRDLRVKMWGSFSLGWAVRASSNVTCDSSTIFVGGLNVGNVPNSTVSNVVRWSKENHPSSWTFSLKLKVASDLTMICWSSDGSTWSVAKTKDHRSAFRVWSVMPTAIAVPETVTVGSLVRVLVPGLSMTSKGALVANLSLCGGTTLLTPLSTISNYSGEGFEFRTSRKAKPHFLCVSVAPFALWSIVPFDQRGDLTFAGNERVPTNRITSFSLTVFPELVRHRQGELSCTPFIAGLRSFCTVEVRNRTKIAIDPRDFAFSLLEDGGGVSECPFPAVIASSPTAVSFSYTPQRSGFEGTLSMTYKSLPLLFAQTNDTKKYFSRTSPVRNLTATNIEWFTQDSKFVKFVVQKTTTSQQIYNSTNLLNLDLFNRSSDWPTQFGVYRFVGSQNGSANGDMRAVWLNSSSSGTIVQSVEIPHNSERCRLRVHYYFLGIALVHEKSVLIGTVTISSQGAQLQRFSLFNYLRTVIVESSSLKTPLTGDVFNLEQIATEFPVLQGMSNVSIWLEIDSLQSRQLYFLEPQLLCATATQTARTDFRDVLALQRIFQTVGVESSLRRWKSGSTFNGDPCTNSWQGVECRNMRVVRLTLDNVSLTGEFPPIRELTRLEELKISNNKLSGRLLVNNSRLRAVDVSGNKLTSLTLVNGDFSFTNQKCVTSIKAHHNALTTFPHGAADLSQLVELDVSFNQIHTTIPQNLSSMTSLAILHLHSNHMVGSLPAALPTGLLSFDVSGNRFTGTIPVWQGLRRTLFLDFSNNALTGTIPWTVGEIPTTDNLVFRAEDNFLDGTVPFFGAKLLDVRHNFFKCPMMSSEIDTNTSVSDKIVLWGASEWCDFNSQ